MVCDLYRTGANSIWEHTLLDPHLLSAAASSSSNHSHNIIKGFTGSSSSSSTNQANSRNQHKKPQPNDPLHPTKSDFIRAKYLHFAYVNKSHGSHGGQGKDDHPESEADFSEQLHSSVRTPNLKTSLRLLVAGANP